MDLLQTDYLHKLNHTAEKNLEPDFKFIKSDFSAFQIINASLFKQLFSKDETNLLISIPTNELPKTILEISILLPVLKCFLHNAGIAKSINVGDIIIQAECGTISSVKAINDNQLFVLPTLTNKRVEIQIDSSLLILNQSNKEKVIEIQGKDTMLKRQNGINNLKSDLIEEIQRLKEIFSYIPNTSKKLPPYSKTKIIIVASKKEMLEIIPTCIPYQYLNKNGKIEGKTSFDPILYVVNDFATAKEFILDKDIEIDTILFKNESEYKFFENRIDFLANDWKVRIENGLKDYSELMKRPTDTGISEKDDWVIMQSMREVDADTFVEIKQNYAATINHTNE